MEYLQNYPYSESLATDVIAVCIDALARTYVQSRQGESNAHERFIADRNLKIGVTVMATHAELRHYGRNSTEIFNRLVRSVVSMQQTEQDEALLLDWGRRQWEGWRRMALGLHGGDLPEHASDAELLWRLSGRDSQEELVGMFGMVAVTG